MSALNRSFSRLHSNITLPATSTLRVQEAVSHLKAFVKADEVMGPALNREPFLQGSYRQDTQVRPETGDEFDVDIVLPINASFVKQNNLAPQQALAILYDRLSLDPFYQRNLERKTRCIRIHYAGAFHVDVTPCMEADGKLFAPDKHRNEWVPTDPEGLLAWLVQQNAESNGHFKRATKYLKIWTRRALSKGHRPPSVALVVFAARHQPMADKRQTNDRYILKTKRDGGDGAFMADLFRIMLECIHGKSGKIQVPHPTNKNEDLARDWVSGDYELFCEQLRHAVRLADKAYNEPDPAKSASIWRDLFGEDFPASEPEE